MKRILIALLLLSTGVQAQRVFTLSDKARISVLTFGPGQNELYSAFGHSGFRVYDPDQQINWAYDYGVFDFDQPHFYLNFAKGYLYYGLGVHNDERGIDYEDVEYHYLSQGRYVHEQILNLTPSQTQKLFDYLQWNALPENRNYRYDYFYNNCATKIRDVVAEALKSDVAFDGSYITTQYTIRELTDIYIEKLQPWGDLGIDVCLGLPMDKKASPSEYMFLPDYVESGFDHATVKNDSAVVPLVKETIRKGEHVPINMAFQIKPIHVFTLVALLGGFLTFYDFKKRKLSNWFDALWLVSTGLIGLLLAFLWFFTDHAAAAKNYNLLWAVPFNLIAGVALFKNRVWLKTYFRALLALALATLLLYGWLPQDLHFALIPLIIMIAARSFAQYQLRSVEG
jgi:hypothetical protein